MCVIVVSAPFECTITKWCLHCEAISHTHLPHLHTRSVDSLQRWTLNLQLRKQNFSVNYNQEWEVSANNLYQSNYYGLAVASSNQCITLVILPCSKCTNIQNSLYRLPQSTAAVIVMCGYTFHTCNHPYISSSEMADIILLLYGCMCEMYSHALWFLFIHFVSQ